MDAPALVAVRAALDAILAQQEPYPALVMDRGWDIHRTNAVARRFFAFFSTVTTLGTPQDVTLQELRIECFHPMDDGTRENVRDHVRETTAR